METRSGKKVGCRYLIVAPGREGADWLVHEAHRLGLTLSSNPIDVGVRVEVPAPVLNELTSVLYESKLEFFSLLANPYLQKLLYLYLYLQQHHLYIKQDYQ